MYLPQNFLNRARRDINLRDFGNVISPIEIVNRKYHVPHQRQYVLRMMVRNPTSDGFKIPTELEWLQPTIVELDNIQQQNGLSNQYVYITVRHGIVTTQTDDIWHADGFSMRVPHVPEQNYIWTNDTPTEYVEQAFPLPTTFNPHKHNIHWYFDKHVEQEKIRVCSRNTIYLFDPYFVHRRPKQAFGTMRTFWRVSFVPIEIEDGQCQQNPLLPVKTYTNQDIRKNLVRWSKNT